MNMKHIALGLLALLLCGATLNAAPAVTLTNLNAAYFLVNANPASIPTNVVLLSGNLTNWQKFQTNVLGSIGGVYAVTNYSIGNGGGVTIITNVSGTNVSWVITGSLYPFYVVASTNIGFDGQFYWGPGTTNVMYRSGTDLVYTNGVTTGTGTSVRILSGDGTEAKITAGGNVMVLKGTAAVELQDGLLTGNELRWWVNRLVPMQTNAVLGNGGAIGSRFEFANVHAFTNTVHGFYDTTLTNYSRLAISHTGTNGAVVVDSQSAGTAGRARPIDISFGGTNIFEFGYSLSPELDPILTLREPDAPLVETTLSQSGGNGVLSSGGALNLTGAGGTWVLSSTLLYPAGQGYQIGYSSIPVGTVIMTNATVQGFYDSMSGDYSKLAISHTGTNGYVTFDSQAAGTAGESRPFLFNQSNYESNYVTGPLLLMQMNGTNRYRFEQDYPSSGADGLRIYGFNGTNWATFGVKQDGGDAHVEAGTGGAVFIQPAKQSQGSYTFSTRALTPSLGPTHFRKDLGTADTNAMWNDSYQAGSVYVYGYAPDVVSTNWNRLAINHTGTNGAVVFDSQSAGTAGAARPFVFRIGVTTNSFRISETNWVDSMVPALGIIPGATAPTLGTFGTGGALKTYMFADNRDDDANFTVQLNHTYKQGTDIQPHVHWAGVATPTTPANTNVVWELTYSWQNVGDTYSSDTTITVTNSFTGTAWKHQLSDLPAISGTGKTVSSIIIGRIRRVANSATADNYDKSCAFLGFDVHHQVDSPGSDNVGSKSF